MRETAVMTSHIWIAVYVLAPIVALVVIAICSKLWLKWKEGRAAEQAQYREAKIRAETGDRPPTVAEQLEARRNAEDVARLVNRLNHRDRAIDVDPDEL